MKIHVKLFAAARQRAEADEIAVEVSEPATIAQLRDSIRVQFPQLGPILNAALFAVNHEYGQDRTPIPPGSEVACIPPVSGG